MLHEANKSPTPLNVFTTLKNGTYLVNVAGCMHCHNKTDKGIIINGSEFGNGVEFRQLDGIFCSPNIAPDKETGIGHWTKQAFVQCLKIYADTSYELPEYSTGILQ